MLDTMHTLFTLGFLGSITALGGIAAHRLLRTPEQKAAARGRRDLLRDVARGEVL